MKLKQLMANTLPRVRSKNKRKHSNSSVNTSSQTYSLLEPGVEQVNENYKRETLDTEKDRAVTSNSNFEYFNIKQSKDESLFVNIDSGQRIHKCACYKHVDASVFSPVDSEVEVEKALVIITDFDPNCNSVPKERSKIKTNPWLPSPRTSPSSSRTPSSTSSPSRSPIDHSAFFAEDDCDCTSGLSSDCKSPVDSSEFDAEMPSPGSSMANSVTSESSGSYIVTSMMSETDESLMATSMTSASDGILEEENGIQVITDSESEFGTKFQDLVPQKTDIEYEDIFEHSIEMVNSESNFTIDEELGCEFGNNNTGTSTAEFDVFANGEDNHGNDMELSSPVEISSHRSGSFDSNSTGETEIYKQQQSDPSQTTYEILHCAEGTNNFDEALQSQKRIHGVKDLSEYNTLLDCAQSEEIGSDTSSVSISDNNALFSDTSTVCSNVEEEEASLLNTGSPDKKSSPNGSELENSDDGSEGDRSVDQIKESLKDKLQRLKEGRKIIENKIREAREEEEIRIQERIRFQKQVTLHRKEMLLATLQSLKAKLADQCFRLQSSYNNVLHMQKTLLHHERHPEMMVESKFEVAV